MAPTDYTNPKSADRSDYHPFIPQYIPRDCFLRSYCEDNPVPQTLPSLPSPWPWPTAGRTVAGEMCWKGAELGQNAYVSNLSKGQLEEIADAAITFRDSGRSLEELNKSVFSVPTLTNLLATIRSDLHKGPGLSVLRGINPSGLSQRELFTIFAGISSHVSPHRARQSGRKAIVHMTDLSKDGTRVVPGPYRSSELPFHTDPSADVVAMFVIETAAQGGQGILCPVSTIFNELALTRPDLLLELAKTTWPFDRPPDGVGNFYRRPVMFLGDVSGAPEMIFSRGALIRSPSGYRPEDIPDLTEKQNAALDALHFAAVRSRHRLVYQKGDLVFFNNRRLLHGREGFRDGGSGKRLILRLWLRDEQLAGVPPAPLNRVWDETVATRDETNDVADDNSYWPTEPCDA